MRGHWAASPYACSAMERSVSPVWTVYSSLVAAEGVAAERADSPLLDGLGLGGATITKVGRTAASDGAPAPRLRPRRTMPTPRAIPSTAATTSTRSAAQGQRR